LEASHAPYFALVNLFVFSAYFSSAVVGDPVRGQILWSQVFTLAAVALGLGGPVLGAMADATGRRKVWIAACTLIALPGMFGLAFAAPGMGEPGVYWVMAGLFLAMVGVEFIPVFQNALLPAIAKPNEIGTVSGYAMSATNVLSFSSLLFFLLAWSWTDAPLFGLDLDAGEPQRAVGLIAGGAMLILSAPFFLLTPDTPPSTLRAWEAIARAFRSVLDTIGKLRRFPNTASYMGARMIYLEGFIVLGIFTGVFAAGIMRWPATTIAVQGLINTLFAVAGGLLASWLDRRIGAKRTVMAVVLGCLAANITLCLVTADSVFFIPVTDDPEATGLFPSAADKVFSLAQASIAMFTGIGWAATRTLMVRLSPKEEISQFLGLFNLTGRAASFSGPLAIGVVTSVFQNQRAGLGVGVAFLVGGLVWMSFVKDPDDG
jgi:UMF1 family MFS transporter